MPTFYVQMYVWLGLGNYCILQYTKVKSRYILKLIKSKAIICMKICKHWSAPYVVNGLLSLAFI